MDKSSFGAVVAILLGICAVLCFSIAGQYIYSWGYQDGRASVKQEGTLTIDDNSFIGCSNGAGLVRGLSLDGVRINDKRTSGYCVGRAVYTQK